jgi:hypothetical protein
MNHLLETKSRTPLPNGATEHAHRADSMVGLEALRPDSAGDSDRRIGVADGAERGGMMTQQAAMLGFMDCFHLLSIVVLMGLPLAFLIRHFEIAKGGGGGH